MQRTILCYGDSNTWGYVPLQANSNNQGIKRYSRNQRWTGLLQDFLGKNYYIVEEGLNSRTTNINYHVPPDRNGKTYLAPCLYTHAPIDLVIIALGGNDLKVYFNRTPEDIAEGLADLVNIVLTSKYGKDMQVPPEVLIVAQSVPLAIAESYVDEDGVFVFEGGIEKAKKLIGLYAVLAEKMGCHFLDVSGSVFPSEIDGMHLDEVGHREFARVVFEKIEGIFAS